MKVHDVTLTLRPGMITWKKEPGPRIEPLSRIATGGSANVSLVSLGDHTGTHVDPPNHFIDGAPGVDELPVDALVGPCRVIGYDGADHVSAAWLDRAGVSGERLLFRTRNSELWRTGAPFAKDFVALDDSAARWCVDRGVRLVGIDYLSIEPYGEGPRAHPVHVALLEARVVIIEGLDLSAVAAGTYELFCGPLRIEGGTGSPARVLLVER